MSKDSLDAPVNYSASDSMVMEVKTKRIILYSKATVKQKDMELTADSIEMDQPSNTVIAVFRRDSLGNMIGRPKMVQADSKMESDMIRYNFKTQRGFTKSTTTVQGEMIVHGETIKKINETDYYALRGQMTTCNLDTPHFAFRTKKMKLVNKKLAVSGPIHPEFEGVPVPIYLPFGFSRSRRAGTQGCCHRSLLPANNSVLVSKASAITKCSTIISTLPSAPIFIPTEDTIYIYLPLTVSVTVIMEA